MEDFLDKLHIGQVLSACIYSVNDTGITLTLRTGTIEIPKEELLTDNYNKDDYKEKIGEVIRVMVVGKNPIKLSEKAMYRILKEEADIEEIKNGKIFEVVINGANKGGLIGKYGSYQVFIPASQIRIGFVKDLEKYIGKTLRLKAEIVESRGIRRQIVGSQRVVLESEKQERDARRAEENKAFIATIHEGDVVQGTITGFASFGTFVDVQGFSCLLPNSEICRIGILEAQEVYKEGVQYQFIIKKVDRERQRVALSCYVLMNNDNKSSILDNDTIGESPLQDCNESDETFDDVLF